jgi:pimeloyl-ACP methyl ester carboxylesterase
MGWEAPERVPVGEISLAVRRAGEGPAAVLLLHGFPDSSRLWRHQVAALTGAGLRVIAPDLRGYGDSDRPARVADYAIPAIVADAVGLLDALGVERAHVVGHDWGAVVAWVLAATRPERVDRLAALSVGHPGAFAQRSIAQRERSWYMLLFQFEGVAEELLRRDDWRLLRELARGRGDVEDYVRDLARPGALTAALNWYRANVPPEAELEPRPPLPAVVAPTLGVWGSDDPYLLEERMTGSEAFMAGPWRYERLEGVGHWIPLDAPDRLSALLVEHLTR